MHDFIYSEEGRTFLAEEYVEARRSIHEIAEQLEVYPSLIRRGLLYHGFTPRSHSEAQRIALESGRHKHPTRGTRRPPEIRLAISESVAVAWKNMSEYERIVRSDRARQQWNAMSEADRQAMKSLAMEQLRLASRDGSKLEHYLALGLRAQGYQVVLHQDHVVARESMHLDIAVPVVPFVDARGNHGIARVAIEVDGPSHYLPIWGEEKLKAVVEADAAKSGMLLAAGWRLIRVKHLRRTTTDFSLRHVLAELLTRLAGPSEMVTIDDCAF